jgi:3-oxoacyl-[acyl-carrier protein] reductase
MTTTESRVAIITGAANGIGRATAEAFARAGYHVVGWDLDADAGLSLVESIGANGGSAEYTIVDVTQAEAVERAVETIIAARGRIDVLVNNAGILRDGMLVKVKQGEVVGKLGAESFDAVIAVNLKGVFTCTSAVSPHMIARRYGRILNASSISTATSARPTTSLPRPA